MGRYWPSWRWSSTGTGSPDCGLSPNRPSCHICPALDGVDTVLHLATTRRGAATSPPHPVLRATRFNDRLLAGLEGLARLPVMPLPPFRVQPVDVRKVADRLVELADGEPVGRSPDFGGPETATPRVGGHLPA
jgi:hypothetical protein